MARALQQAEYNGEQEDGEKDQQVPFTGLTGEADFDLDEQIARELQLKDWQEEEKKKKAAEDEEGAEKVEKEEGDEEKKEEENIEGVDMVALKAFIAKEVEKFFDQKLSEIMNPAAWAAYEE